MKINKLINEDYCFTILKRTYAVNVKILVIAVNGHIDDENVY